MAKSKIVPLKITATLVDGRFSSADGILMFDSILYHAWFVKYAPHVLEGIYRPEEIGYVGLPLKQLPHNTYSASKAIYEEIATEVDYYTKRPNFMDADKAQYLNADKGIISSSVGLYRAYRNPQLIRTVKDKKMIFYAMGNKEKIEDLLSVMLAVGKKYAMGYGFVSEWRVEEIENDYSIEHPEYGLMRPIEVEVAEKKYDAPILQYGIRPPYWKAKNTRLCYVPIKEN